MRAQLNIATRKQYLHLLEERIPRDVGDSILEH